MIYSNILLGFWNISIIINFLLQLCLHNSEWPKNVLIEAASYKDTFEKKHRRRSVEFHPNTNIVPAMAAVFRRSLSLQKGVQCLSTLKPSVSRTAVPLLSPARPLIRGPFRCQLHTSPSRRERAEVPLATKEEPPLTEASSLVTELPPLPKSPSSSGAPSFAFAFE